MKENDVASIIDQAIKGNEFPFNKFFEETFQKLQPRLKTITNCDDDIKDIYLISMQKFWERFVINQEKLPNNCTGYIKTMCKNAFLMKKREAWSSVVLSETTDIYNKNPVLENLNDTGNNINNELLKHNALVIALEDLGDKCKKLIENELNKGLKLRDLMDELGYSNYQALVQAKYNCKKRLIKKVIKVFATLRTEKMGIK